MRRIITSIFILFVITGQASANESNIFKSEYSKVSLISENSQIQPGKEFWLALKFEQTPNWHIYWQNPGDSGLPPKLEWEEHPDVIFDSEIYWERPDAISVDQLLNYGFSRPTVLLPIKAFLKKDFTGKEVEIKLAADWLICKVDCIPESQTFVLKLPVGPATENNQALKFSESFKLQPKAKKLSAKYYVQDSKLVIQFDQLPKIKGKPHFTFIQQSISKNTLEQQFEDRNLILEIAPENQKIPESLFGVLLDLDASNHSTAAYHVKLSLEQEQIISTIKTENNTSAQVQQQSSSKEKHGLLLIICFAFLGGIILNLMPCVFPIISMKVLDFINLSSKDSKVARRHALSFAAGIISLMLSLAILAEVLKLFGQNLGWGFQLQSPLFVSFLVILFYLLGLSFAGYFYVGNKIMSKTAAIKTEKSYFGSFMNGALATLVATPCTAPFMGTALGATLTLNFFYSLLIFTSLGIGIAFPFILLTYNQTLINKIPRPGAWMEKLKQFMSFLMFLTSLWLLWVVISLTNGEYAIGLLFTLIILTMVIWIKDNFCFESHLLKLMKALLITALLVFALFPLSLVNQFKKTENSGPETNNAYGLAYQDFSEELLKQELAAGKAVYIDFTARWCITCQVNKKRVFSSFEVRDYFQKNNISLLVADWTNQDEKIKISLNKYGRNSVPLNIIYGNKDNAGNYVILPALLSARAVMEKLQELTLIKSE